MRLICVLSGGLAEIVWIALYGWFVPVSGTETARQVTASVLPAVAPLPASAAIGVLSKLLLGVTMAAVLELGSRHDRGRIAG